MNQVLFLLTLSPRYPPVSFVGLESADEKLRIHLFLVTDNLFAQGTIPQNLIAISFQPSSTGHEANGAITFGGVDTVLK